jgi:hypothetical protein
MFSSPQGINPVGCRVSPAFCWGQPISGVSSQSHAAVRPPHWVWKCCGDANVTRCWPLSHVTSVIDAEWFWRSGGGGASDGVGEREEVYNWKRKIRVMDNEVNKWRAEETGETTHVNTVRNWHSGQFKGSSVRVCLCAWEIILMDGEQRNKTILTRGERWSNTRNEQRRLCVLQLPSITSYHHTTRGRRLGCCSPYCVCVCRWGAE